MLTGKIALVTGAGRGIGREIALTLAKNGATVIVNYNGSRESAEEVVAKITQDGGNAEAMQCNVSDFASSGEFVKEVLAKYKKVDILVNNAGVTRDNLIMRMSEEDYDAAMLKPPVCLNGTACIISCGRRAIGSTAHTASAKAAAVLRLK